MRVHVSNTLDDLTGDLRKVAKTARDDMREVVRDGIRAGNLVAKDYARRANGPKSHARKYPSSFSSAMRNGLGLFGNTIVGEYGPTRGGQGSLAPVLEHGSRSGNAPQNNLAKSADLIGPAFAAEVRRLPDKWFWPES